MTNAVGFNFNYSKGLGQDCSAVAWPKLVTFRYSERITGWAVALTCCISHRAKSRKRQILTPQGAETP